MNTLLFSPRPPRNLGLLSEMESLAPLLHLQGSPVTTESAQLFAFCGKGPRSSLRVLRHGLKISDLAESQLPGVPNAVWTIREDVQDADDRFIIVSFEDATLVLRVGETVEEVHDSQFVGGTKTLCVGQLADGSVVQVRCVCVRACPGF
jgi:splicing factor 3B subunit 3